MIFKKRHITFIWLLINLSIYGQNKEINAGIKLGLNYTTPMVPDLKSMAYNHKFGLHAGAYLSYRFSYKLGLLVECVYSSQNMFLKSVGTNNGDGTFDRLDINQKIKEDYLNVPLLFRYKIKNKFNIDVGTQFGILYSKGNRFLIEKGIIYYNDREAIDNFGVSGILGIGYQTKANFNLGVRYNFGINQINGFKNSVFQTYIAYSIFNKSR